MRFFLRNLAVLFICFLILGAKSIFADVKIEAFDLAKELQAIEARLEPWQKQVENPRYALTQKLANWVKQYSTEEMPFSGSSFDPEGKPQKEVLAKQFELFIRWVQKRDPTFKQHLKVLYSEASALHDRPLTEHEVNLVARMQARVLSWVLVEDLRPYREALADRFVSDNRGLEALFKMNVIRDPVMSRKPWRWSFLSDWQSFELLSNLDSSYMGLQSLASSAGAELEIEFLKKQLGDFDSATTEELKRLIRVDLAKNSAEQTVRGEFLDEVIDYLLEAEVSSLKNFKNPHVKHHTKTRFNRIFLNRPGERALVFSAYRKALRTLVTNRLRSQPCQSVLKKIHP